MKKIYDFMLLENWIRKLEGRAAGEVQEAGARRGRGHAAHPRLPRPRWGARRRDAQADGLAPIGSAGPARPP